MKPFRIMLGLASAAAVVVCVAAWWGATPFHLVLLAVGTIAGCTLVLLGEESI